VIGLVIIAGIVGGVMYGLRREDPTQNPTLTPTMTPSMTPTPLPLDPIVYELKDIIAPTEDDLLPIFDPTTPQAKAIVWLQEDPLALTPGRSKRTVLERYILMVLYYSTSGPDWPYLMWNRDDICTWNRETEDWLIATGLFCVSGTLNFLDLINNNLRGTIPWEIGLLTDLGFLSLMSNSLTGSIPSQVGDMSRLEYFRVSNNTLTGTLPAKFPSTTIMLDLAENFFSGTIPSEWGTTVPVIGSLALHLNNLTGTIPASLGQLTKLSTLYFAYNSLTGTIPTTLGLLTNMEWMDVFDNQLTGTIPSELGRLSMLTYFPFHTNKFTGSVNEVFCGRAEFFDQLEADCDEVECPCCTYCYNSTDG